MMSDHEMENTSPPLPSRGAYSFNFDDVDEFSNPFQSSNALSNSPLKPDIENTFQVKPKPQQESPRSAVPVTESPEQDEPYPQKQDVTPDTKTLTSEPDLEASPQTYYSTEDNLDDGSLSVVPSGSVLSIESEDVWCDAQETVGSVVINDKACNNFKSQPQTVSPEHASNQTLSNSIGLGSDNSADLDVASKDSTNRTPQKSQDESRQSKKGSGKTLAKEKSKSPAKVGEAGETVVESELEKRKRFSKAAESMDEFEEMEVKSKRNSMKLKDLEEDNTEVKKVPDKSSNFGKEGQTVEEKDTDTKLQDAALKEENESAALPDKSVLENELPKKRLTGAKRKTKSKLKKPTTARIQDDDEIQIYAPPKPKTAVDSVAQLHPDPARACQMAQSLEMVHEFGAGDDGEMPEEANEGFVPASEVFTDTAAWEILDKFSGDTDVKASGPGGESMFINHDPLVQQAAGDVELAKRKGLRSGSETRDEAATTGTDEVLNSSGKSSGSSRQTKLKHPAARVLEENIDGAAAGEPHELNADQVITGKSAMAGDSKDAVVHLVQVLKYSQSDWNKKQQELELDFQAQVLSKEKEWSKKLGDRDKKISNLEEQSRHMRQTNEDMRMVITEFEKTVSLLQADKEKNSNASQQSLQEAIRERDQASEDLHSVEAAFAGLHQRYEKTKGIIEGFKQNESVLKKCVEEAQSKLRKSEEKLLSLKKQAEEKFERVSVELDKERRTHSTEIARLQAAVKKSELQIQGLEMSLQQKIDENHELTSICDELIAKVGIE